MEHGHKTWQNLDKTLQWRTACMPRVAVDLLHDLGCHRVLGQLLEVVVIQELHDCLHDTQASETRIGGKLPMIATEADCCSTGLYHRNTGDCCVCGKISRNLLRQQYWECGRTAWLTCWMLRIWCSRWSSSSCVLSSRGNSSSALSSCLGSSIAAHLSTLAILAALSSACHQTGRCSASTDHRI